MLDGFQVARVIADLLTLPALKRMRSAAADLHMMAGGGAQHRLLNRAQLRGGLVDIAADAGGDLQHAFGNVMLGLARFQRAPEPRQSARKSPGQIETRRVDDLKLQLDTEGKRLGAVKIR